MNRERKKVLVTVRTYPHPAWKGVEVSCTAGITEDGEWVRLYPIPYRLMESDQRFQKWQWIEVDVYRPSRDPRIESYSPFLESLRITDDKLLSTSNNWAARKEIVYKLRGPSMCELEEECRRNNHPTLGLIRPYQIERLLIQPDSPEWSVQQSARLQQSSMFDKLPSQRLEKIPYKFVYRFKCSQTCDGHEKSCTDWEMMEFYRRCRREYGHRWEEQFRNRYEREMIQLNDTHFFVGTLSDHVYTWIVVGVWYPRRTEQLGMLWPEL